METLTPIAIFIFVASITPGPNNLMLAASGVNFGLRATLPHILGIQLGLYSLVIIAALGIGPLMLAVPGVMLGLKFVASLYLVYLAWKVLGSSLARAELKIVRPLSSVQALLLQFANPKAWVMTSSAIALSLPLLGSTLIAAITLCGIWSSLGLLCNVSWVLAGSSIRQRLQSPQSRRVINSVFALLILATVALFWTALPEPN
jgi:threonine/homoserine/homoserine lactone efflux protein